MSLWPSLDLEVHSGCVHFKSMNRLGGLFGARTGHTKTRVAHSDQIYIHSRCAAGDVRPRRFLSKIRRKKVSATASSTYKVFVRRFGWNFEANFLLSLVALENIFLAFKNFRRKLSEGATK